MGPVLRVVVLSIVAGVGAVVAVLAGISGVIAAVAWGCDTFGTVPVLIVGALITGAILMHAVDRGVAEARAPREADRPTPTG
jgi:hypothetical protein